MALLTEEFRTTRDLQRNTKDVLDTAEARPVSIPRDRAQPITLVRRELWTRAAKALDRMTEAAAFMSFVSDTRAQNGKEVPYPVEHEWLRAFDADELSEFLGEYSHAMRTAVIGARPWEDVDDVVEQWRRSALVLQDAELMERLQRTIADVRPEAAHKEEAPR